MIQRRRPRHPLRRELHDVGGDLERRDDDPHDREQPHERQHAQRDGEGEAVTVEASHAQYSVWPRKSRNCKTEKTRMTANSTHAMAEAAPNWKKF